MLEDFDSNLDSGPPPEESDNRTFLLIAGVLGGIMLLSLLCMAGYFIVTNLTGGGGDPNATEAAGINAQNTEFAQFLTQTAEVARYSPTPTDTSEPTATSTSTPTVTPLIATEATLDLTDIARTDTVGDLLLTAEARETQNALETLAAAGGLTPTVTELAGTGFADDVGAPGLLAFAAVLLVVIFLARRLRVSPT